MALPDPRLEGDRIPRRRPYWGAPRPGHALRTRGPSLGKHGRSYMRPAFRSPSRVSRGQTPFATPVPALRFAIESAYPARSSMRDPTPPQTQRLTGADISMGRVCP